MPQELTRLRVGFHRLPSGRNGWRLGQVSAVSTEIDLGGYQLRGIASPEGHALGHITVVTHHDDFPPAAVPIPNLVDDDELATVMRVDGDWPLMLTTFTVDHPRDTPFDLFLITQPR